MGNQPNQVFGLATMLMPAAVAASTTSLILDLTDADGADIVIAVGAATGSPDGSNKLVITVKDSPDGVGVNFVAIPADTNLAPNRMLLDQAGVKQASVISLDDAGDFNKVYRLGIRQFAGRPKVMLDIVKTGTISAPISAMATVNYRKAPVNAVVIGVAAT